MQQRIKEGDVILSALIGSKVKNKLSEKDSTFQRKHKLLLCKNCYNHMINYKV